MQQKIPRGLQLLPDLRPVDMVARQVRSFNFHMKQLPAQLNKASFMPMQIKQLRRPLAKKVVDLQEDEQTSLYTIQDKYFQSSTKALSQQKIDSDYKKIYQSQKPSKMDLQFIYQYVPSMFVPLENQQQQEVSKYKRIPRKIKSQLSSQYVKEQQPIIMLANCKNQLQQPLLFDSKFQSGNLGYVFRNVACENMLEYHVILQNDINSDGYAHWYFFQIARNHNYDSEFCQQITIKIQNLTKPNSLYRYNLRPWIFTEKTGKWVTIPQLPIFKQSNLINRDTGLKYYELTFNLKINVEKIWVSMLPPYTYSKLETFLRPYLKHKNVYIEYIHSIASNSIPIIYYTPSNIQQAEIEENIIITARHHPGETWSSYLMEKIIKYLFTDFENSKKFNKKTRYILIPMLNPDGVIYGNFRCDLSGIDLNRVWTDNDLKFKHPTISKLKKLLMKQQLSEQGKNIFIDLHSHSKSFGIFGYMCHTEGEDGYYNCCKLLSENLSSKSNGIFNQYSTLYIDRNGLLKGSKKETARAYFSKFCPISMTLQISFDGYLDGKYICKFQPKDFELMAKILIQELKIEELLSITLLPTGIIKAQPKQQTKNIRQIEKLQSDSDSAAQAYYSASKKFPKQKKSLLKDLLKKSESNRVCSQTKQKKIIEDKKSKVNRTELSEKLLKNEKIKQHLKTKKNSSNQNKSVPKIRYTVDKAPTKIIKNPTVFQIPNIVELCVQGANSKSFQSRHYNIDRLQHRNKQKNIKNKIYYALNNYQLLKNSNRMIPNNKQQDEHEQQFTSVQGAKIKSYLQMQKQLIHQCSDQKFRPIVKKDKYAHLQKSKIITQIRERMSYAKKSTVMPKQ